MLPPRSKHEMAQLFAYFLELVLSRSLMEQEIATDIHPFLKDDASLLVSSKLAAFYKLDKQLNSIIEIASRRKSNASSASLTENDKPGCLTNHIDV